MNESVAFSAMVNSMDTVPAAHNRSNNTNFLKKFNTMTNILNIYQYRELIGVLAWKNIIVRYKQSYLGLLWAILKPVLLMLIFTLVKSFVGIESGDIPYPVLVFAALMPWIFFQESASEGVGSVVGNASLVRKVYFPREIFPITATITKFVELLIGFCILAVLMYIYDMSLTMNALWVPLIIFYTMIVALCISFAGSAANVYYRDVSTALPVLLSLFMYASPVIYPLTLVHEKLIVQQAAGDWSTFLYNLYLLNPLAGIIDNFQRVLLKGLPPEFSTLLPGMITIAILLPISYKFFKRAEAHFADVI